MKKHYEVVETRLVRMAYEVEGGSEEERRRAAAAGSTLGETKIADLGVTNREVVGEITPWASEPEPAVGPYTGGRPPVVCVPCATSGEDGILALAPPGMAGEKALELAELVLKKMDYGEDAIEQNGSYELVEGALREAGFTPLEEFSTRWKF